MPRLRTIPRNAWLVLLLIVLVGGGLRAGQASDPQPKLSQDALSYTAIAQNLAKNGLYAGPMNRGKDGSISRKARLSAERRALHWPPATPHVFALAYKVAPGDHPASRKDYDTLLWTQWGISTLTIVMAFGLGWVLAGAWTGVAGAAVVALYPPLVWGPSSLLSEPLGALFVVSAFTALALAWRTGRRPWWATAGALFGGVLLTRTDLLFVPVLCPLLGLVVLGSTVSWKRGAQSAGLLVGFCALVLLPWTIYASGKADALVPVTNGGGSALFVGTFLPGNGSTFDMKFALRDQIVKRHPNYATRGYTTIPASVVLDDIARRRPDLERDAALSAEGKENLRRYALGDPVSFGQMMFFKAGKMWTRYARGGFDHTQLAWTVLHNLIVGLSMLGILWAVIRRRDPAVASIGLGVLIATGVHTLAVAHGRYNLPLMPIVIVGGCAGWTWALREWRGSRALRRAPGDATTGTTPPGGPDETRLSPPRDADPHPA